MAPTQANRPIRVDPAGKSPIKTDDLLLESFKGVETVSQPFQFKLTALSAKGGIDLDALLETGLTVSLRMVDEKFRYFHGIVNRAVQGEPDPSGTLISYELEIVPRIWFLSLITDCRIFHQSTVQQIVETIFKEQKFRVGVDFEFNLGNSYGAREYCVQYRETSLNFISRLLEEEGIFYYFVHDRKNHKLILTDQPSKFGKCPGPQPVPRAHSAAGREDDVISSLAREHSVRSRKVTLRDRNYEDSLNIIQQSESWGAYELYDYPGRYLTPELGARYAKIRLEEQKAQQLVVHGSGRCKQLIAGHAVTLKDEPNGLANGSFVLIEVSHDAQCNTYRSDNSGKKPFDYTNNFKAIPASATYRPPQLARKPIVKGSQTAKVVEGPENPTGAEVAVDGLGRVWVHFYWERKDQPSLPVRVSQTWAGKNWGALHTPRVGQEVIVNFLEGDPDRPIVVGRVYNSDQTPPYLPGEKTLSGFKSRSTPDGDPEKYNEIVFEDKKGGEFIRIHAERDLIEHVEKDTYEYIENNRHLTVDGSQLEAIGGEKHTTVKGQRRVAIEGNRSLDVSGEAHSKVGKVYALESGQEIHLKAGVKIIVEAGSRISLVGPGGFVDIGPDGVTIQGTMVKINSGGSKGSGSGSKPEKPKPPVKPPK